LEAKGRASKRRNLLRPEEREARHWAMEKVQG